MYEELVESSRRCAMGYNGACDGCIFCGKSNDKDGDCYQQLHKAAADAIEELSKPKWIPVADRLPENQRPVLVCVPPYTDGEEESVGYVGMAYFTGSANGGFWCGTDGNVYGAIGIIHEPSYWMPLPEPQKEER